MLSPEIPIDRGAQQAAVHKVATVGYDLGSKPPNGKEIQGKGDICVCVADSFCCMAESERNIVKQVYSNPIKTKEQYCSSRHQITRWKRRLLGEHCKNTFPYTNITDMFYKII